MNKAEVIPMKNKILLFLEITNNLSSIMANILTIIIGSNSYLW